MGLKINRRLNLVIPLYGEPAIVDGKEIENVTGYVHAEPIAADVFDKHYLVMAKTFSAIYGEGLGYMAGPRVAAKLMRSVAESLDKADEVRAGLIASMHQRANFIEPGKAAIPLEDAIRGKLIDPEDVDEVENAICFFNVASLMHHRSELKTVLSGASSLWGARTSSSNSTELADSLKTSTAPVTIGEKAKPSPIPY